MPPKSPSPSSSSSSLPRRAFLVVRVGDAATHAAQADAYARTQRFLSERGELYALPVTSLEQLSALAASDDDDERARAAAATAAIVEAYDGEHAFASLGAARCEPAVRVDFRVDVELFADAAPRTVENFAALCTGERGKSKASGKVLHYAGVRFHRVERDFVAQGGDTVKQSGAGVDSIFGGRYFKDEPGGLALPHTRGTLSMANSGKHTNGCQFFIVLGESATKLDGRHVVFGALRGALADSLVARLNAATDDEVRAGHVSIVDCGVARDGDDTQRR